MSECSKSQEKLSQLFERVREMPVGGDLEGLVVKELAQLQRLVMEESLAAREAILTSREAAFPPSGMSALQSRPDGGNRP